uniref:Uncharacterized protein n=1 Tax=Anopheles arabiensis TaxID=7173 RepID=A0A182HQP6_ANOAR
MGRINKLETDVELDVVPGSQHHPSSSSPLSSSGLSSYTSQNYEHYGKEFFFGTYHPRLAVTKKNKTPPLCQNYSRKLSESFSMIGYCNKHRDILCAESDDSFLRPPLWEDITSSIQNIDPENAIMLGTMNGIPQVKMEAVDDPFLEPLSSPLLSPLEIKTEKSNLLAQSATNHNNNLSHLHNNNNNSIHQNHMHSDVTSCHASSNNNSNATNNGSNNFLSNNGSGYTHSIATAHASAATPARPYGDRWCSDIESTSWSDVPRQICSIAEFQLMYVPPLTPPNSDPGSPGNNLQNPPRRTPPPPYHQQQQQHQQQQHQQQQVLQGTHIHHHSHGGMVSAQSIAGPTQPQLLQPLPPNAALAAQPTQPNAITANGSLHPLTPSIPSAIGSLTATSGTSTGSGNTSNTSGSSASTRNGSSSRGSSSKRQSSAHSINSVLSSAGVVKHIVGRYNRRNNPELEKRRIHHCDFIVLGVVVVVVVCVTQIAIQGVKGGSQH